MKQLLTFLLISVITFHGLGQIQIGEDIVGDFSGAFLGYVVASSDDGNKILTTSTSYTQVHEFDGTNWVQLGSNIPNPPSSTNKHAFALSGDGLKIAIGSTATNANGTFAGEVFIYSYNGSDWIQTPETIMGNHLDYFGSSVTMSYDGNRIAVFGRHAPEFKGRVAIYEFNGTGWIQIGNGIVGTWEDDNLGAGLSLSHDGNIIAIGTLTHVSSDKNGYARIYEYNGSDWVQLGNDVSSNDNKDRFGFSLSLSEDGKTVAVGAFLNDENNATNSGLVQVYNYVDNNWEQKGENLYGDGANDNFGVAVSISNDGNKLAVGACLGQAEFSNPFGAETGSARIYSFNGSAWENIHMDIDGQPNEYLGYSVSLSGDGNRIICGSPSYDFPENEGKVTVYSVGSTTYIRNHEEDLFYNAYPNPAIDKFQIDFNKNYKKIDVVLINAFGQKVSDSTFYNQDRIALGLGLSDNGLYFARIKLDGNKFFTIKIIKK